MHSDQKFIANRIRDTDGLDFVADCENCDGFRCNDERFWLLARELCTIYAADSECDASRATDELSRPPCDVYAVAEWLSDVSITFVWIVDGVYTNLLSSSLNWHRQRSVICRFIIRFDSSLIKICT